MPWVRIFREFSEKKGKHPLGELKIVAVDMSLAIPTKNRTEDIFGNYLAVTNINFLHLQDNKMSHTMFENFCHYLLKNKTITSLYIKNNELSNTNFKSLADTLW